MVCPAHLRDFLYNMRIMSRHDDNRRASTRARGSSRNGGAADPRRQSASFDGTGSQRPVRPAKSASLRDLHPVSPEMRERYGVSGQGQTRRRPANYADERDYYDDPRDARRRGAADDWRSPSVDPIGGRNLRGNSRQGGRASAIASRFSLPMIIGIIVVLVLLVAVIVLATSRCSEGSAGVDGQGAQTEQSTESTDAGAMGSESSDMSGSGSEGASSSASASSSATSNINRSALTKILDEEVADKLINRATTSDEAKWIAEHPDKYAMDGENVQRKLLKLAADEPAAQTYVRNFPDKYPMQTPASGQVKTVTTGANVPRFYQWDELWGYTTYSGTAFGLTGCGPTCMAMVYQGVTGNHDLSPYDMAELAVRDGYADEYEGTYNAFFMDEASALGMSVTDLDLTEKALKDALQSHSPVIANFGPGLFTEYGHYVVLTGETQDGSIIMNDPYSEERSNRTWDIKTIVQEAQALYAYNP